MSYQYPSPALSGYGATPGAPTYPYLSQVLATPDGFKRSVAFNSAAIRALPVVLLFALVFLLRNLSATSRALPGSRLGFWQMFFVTNGGHGTDPILVLYVWGPLVLIALAVVLLIVHRLGYSSSVAKVHADYLRGGFVATLTPTGVRCRGGNRASYIYLFGAPTIDPATVGAAAQRLTALATDKGGQARTYQAAMENLVKGQRGRQAVEARSADPMLPPGVFAVAQFSATTPRPVVAVPTGADFTRLSIHRLRSKAPLS